MEINFLRYRFLESLAESLKDLSESSELRLRMSPPGRVNISDLSNYSLIKQSAVLCLLDVSAENLQFLLIRRTEYNGVHSRQIAFPGGKLEPNETSLEAAKRECFEEVGIDESQYDIIGELSKLYIPVSNFLVHPYVAVLKASPSFTLNKDEVEEILWLPYEVLNSPEIRVHQTIQTQLGKLEVPVYQHFENMIWGATAIIIEELCIHIKKLK